MRLKAWFPLIGAPPSARSNDEAFLAARPAQTTAAPSPAPAAEQPLAYTSERAEVRAARWLLSAYLAPSNDDYRDWMEGRAPYLAICLRRPQFDDVFDGAVGPCANETKKLLGTVPAAAGPPPTKRAMKTPGFLQFWPVLETLAGARATSYRARVEPFRHPCLFGCPTIESKKNIDDVARCMPERSDGDAIPRAIARLAAAFKSRNFLRDQNGVNLGPASIIEARTPVLPPYNACDMNAAAIAAARRALRLCPECPMEWVDMQPVEERRRRLAVESATVNVVTKNRSMIVDCVSKSPEELLSSDLIAQHVRMALVARDRGDPPSVDVNSGLHVDSSESDVESLLGNEEVCSVCGGIKSHQLSKLTCACLLQADAEACLPFEKACQELYEVPSGSHVGGLPTAATMDLLNMDESAPAVTTDMSKPIVRTELPEHIAFDMSRCEKQPLPASLAAGTAALRASAAGGDSPTGTNAQAGLSPSAMPRDLMAQVQALAAQSNVSPEQLLLAAQQLAGQQPALAQPAAQAPGPAAWAPAGGYPPSPQATSPGALASGAAPTSGASQPRTDCVNTQRDHFSGSGPAGVGRSCGWELRRRSAEAQGHVQRPGPPVGRLLS
ncbi:unnamed protein product [Prorocentrum cordatum]|uniref:Uncharacterized protein n=1 Tax=Prorocentrum cordatum TaxID=2364126 RepID=A0ABN9YJ37_9DINO|nr:unnamed protein product [Polarella glacialis]